LAPTQRVLILSEHPYPDHATVRRNVEQLLGGGVAVDLMCLAPRAESAAASSRDDGLRVLRLRMKHRRTAAYRYIQEYLGFWLWAFAMTARLSLRNRYDAVLVDNPPDFLVMAALPARLRGARVVLEMFELVPELTAVRLRLARGHPILGLARVVERLSGRMADRIIVVSAQCRDLLVGRGADARKISIIPNTIPSAALPGHADSVGDDDFIVTHCSLVERYGVQVAIRALRILRESRPRLTLRVLGDGEYRPALEALARELGLEGAVIFRGFVPWTAAMSEIRRANAGIVAIIADGYGELLLPTKLLEYAANGVPVSCARLPTIAHHFPSDSLAYFTPGDAADLARQLDWLLSNGEAAAAQARRASIAMHALSWDVVGPRYMAALGFGAAPEPSGLPA